MFGHAGCSQLRDTRNMTAEVFTGKYFQEEWTTVFVVYER